MLRWELILALSVLVSPAMAQTVTVRPPPPPPLRCEVGPVPKTFGNTAWLVYGCADNRSLIVLPAPGNPARPFYFLLTPGENGYRLVGEGTGRQSVTRAAFAALKALTDEDIAALLEETRR